MNKANTSSVLWTLIKVLLICSFCFSWIRVIRWPSLKEAPTVGSPLFHEKVHLIWGELSDYLICDDKLVLLYDDKRVVQFYSLNGDPLFSYSFAFQEKGSANLYTDGNDLIVEDYNRNYYWFSKEGVLRGYVTDKNRKDELNVSFLSSAEARIAEDGSIYQLRGASIYRIEKEETQIIISRPFFMSIFQGASTLLLTLLFTILLFVRDGLNCKQQRAVKKPLKKYPF